MLPEEVPIHFSRDTLVLAFTAWTMGALMFQGSENEHVLGQLVAVFAGQRLNDEIRGSVGPLQAHLDAFRLALRDQVPASITREFDALAAEEFGGTYDAIAAQARIQNIDIAEFADALVSIAAVTKYMSTRMMKDA